MSYLRLVAVICVALTSARSVSAQLPDMQPLAARMAKAIAKSKQHSVLVFDFYGPDKKSTELGRVLADKFSEALAQSSVKFTVADRLQTAAILGKKGLSLEIVNNIDVGTWVAGQLGIYAVVVGTLARTGDNLDIEVNSYRVDSQKWITDFKTSAPISDQIRNLTSERVDFPAPPGDPNVPAAGKNGYTFPTCGYCPQAQYAKLAVQKHTEGTVLLSVVVGTDGKAHDILVMKPVPNGLTETAIEAVQSWRFNPANGPDGNPAAVRQTIEVSFHLYRGEGPASVNRRPAVPND
jgi:TonB family protein